jgi:hypothetical protein
LDAPAAVAEDSSIKTPPRPEDRIITGFELERSSNEALNEEIDSAELAANEAVDLLFRDLHRSSLGLNQIDPEGIFAVEENDEDDEGKQDPDKNSTSNKGKVGEGSSSWIRVFSNWLHRKFAAKQKNKSWEEELRQSHAKVRALNDVVMPQLSQQQVRTVFLNLQVSR